MLRKVSSLRMYAQKTFATFVPVPEHMLAYVKRIAPWAFVDEKQVPLKKPRKKR